MRPLEGRRKARQLPLEGHVVGRIAQARVVVVDEVSIGVVFLIQVVIHLNEILLLVRRRAVQIAGRADRVEKQECTARLMVYVSSIAYVMPLI